MVGWQWRDTVESVFFSKGTVQQFLEEFFDSVTFSDSCEGVPLILKYVLDMLDQEATRNGIIDPDIIHSW